jgi:hypothetical protein
VQAIQRCLAPRSGATCRITSCKPFSSIRLSTCNSLIVMRMCRQSTPSLRTGTWNFYSCCYVQTLQRCLAPRSGAICRMMSCKPSSSVRVSTCNSLIVVCMYRQPKDASHHGLERSAHLMSCKPFSSIRLSSCNSLIVMRMCRQSKGVWHHGLGRSAG